MAFFLSMKPSQLISLWFGLFMILVVGVGALAMTFTDFWIERLSGTKRIFFIAMLYAYAIYRGIRIYQQLKQSKYND